MPKSLKNIKRRKKTFKKKINKNKKKGGGWGSTLPIPFKYNLKKIYN